MKKLNVKSIWIFLFVVATNLFFSAGMAEAAVVCRESLVSTVLSAATETLNKDMLSRYPELAPITENPDVFIKEVEALFKEQQKKTPQDPYRFPYSKLGKPIFLYMVESLKEQRKFLNEQSEILEKKLNGRNIWNTFVRKSQLQKKQHDLEVTEAYLRDLENEAQKTISSGDYNYRQVIEFSYFFSRFIGHHDFAQLGLVMRLMLPIDGKANGYRQMSIEQEYDLYKRRAFSVFQNRVRTQTFGPAEIPFQEAFFNARELELIGVPTNAALNNDIFMRLMPKKIHFIGVTLDPILADGFNRPGGLFWMHDVRHESAKYYYHHQYRLKNKLSLEKMEVMNQKSDDWILELNREIETIQDPNLKNAVKLFSFNYHHDLGAPLIPSAFLRQKTYYVALLLYMQMKISGQGVSFPRPVYNYRRADAWLTEFWKPRLEQERQLLRSLQSSP